MLFILFDAVLFAVSPGRNRKFSLPDPLSLRPTSSALACFVLSLDYALIIHLKACIVYWQYTRNKKHILGDFVHLKSCISCAILVTVEKEAHFYGTTL